MNILIRLFEKYGYLSSACKVALEQNTQIFNKKKTEFLLNQGQLSGSLYVLQKGYVRAFHTKTDGSERDLWFAFENTIIGSTYQMYKSRASLHSIQCMEDCVVHAIPNAVLLRLYNEFPELNVIARRFTEDYCLELEQRAFILQTMTINQRYIILNQQLHNNAKRVADSHVASYLGISLDTLDRIKKI